LERASPEKSSWYAELIDGAPHRFETEAEARMEWDRVKDDVQDRYRRDWQAWINGRLRCKECRQHLRGLISAAAVHAIIWDREKGTRHNVPPDYLMTDSAGSLFKLSRQSEASRANALRALCRQMRLQVGRPELLFSEDGLPKVARKVRGHHAELSALPNHVANTLTGNVASVAVPHFETLNPVHEPQAPAFAQWGISTTVMPAADANGTSSLQPSNGGASARKKKKSVTAWAVAEFQRRIHENNVHPESAAKQAQELRRAQISAIRAGECEKGAVPADDTIRRAISKKWQKVPARCKRHPV